MKKRVVSLLLCLIMALSLIPTVAFADDTDANANTPAAQQGEIAVYDKKIDPPDEKFYHKEHKFGYDSYTYGAALPGNVTVKVDGTTLTKGQANSVTVEQALKGITITIDPGYYIDEYKYVCFGKYGCETAKKYPNKVLTKVDDPNATSATFTLSPTKVDFGHSSQDGPYWLLLHVKEDSKLYPVSYNWGAIADKITENVPQTENYKVNALVTVAALTTTAEAQATAAGYEFLGWRYGESTFKANDKFNMPQNAVELVAQWKTIEQQPTTGGIKVKKVVTGLTDAQLANQTFTFELKQGEKSFGTFEIKNGESCTFTNLESGAYTLTETGSEVLDYNCSTTGIGSITVEAGKTTEVTVTNAYTPNPGTDVNNYATVYVKKFTTGDEKMTQLADAQFKLEKQNATGGWDVLKTSPTEANKDLAFENLDDGVYRLTETVAPTGHVLDSTPFTFTVTKILASTEIVNNQTIKTYNYMITAVDGNQLDKELYNTRHTFDIPNDKIATVTANIPIVKNVTKGLNSSNPGTATFTFKAEAYYNKQWVPLTCTGNTITTTGVGSKAGTISVVIPTEYFSSDNKVTIKITEVNDKQDNWTYSNNNYEVRVTMNNGNTIVESMPSESNVFTNTYNYTYTPPTRPTNPIRRQPTTPKKTVESVKTGDMGIALYAVTSLLSLSGTALVIKKRKDEK